MSVAQCHLCPWKSVSLPEGTAKKIGTVHVCLAHPKEYLEATKRDTLPVPSDWDKWELDVWTDRETTEA